MKITVIIPLLFFCISLFAQNDTTQYKSKAGYKKFQVGLSFINAWSNVNGNTPQYFYKPSLGGTIRVEYYPWNFLGFSLGAGFQQRGAGVILPDTGFTAPSTNTYRMRLRFNFVEFPVMVILRTPHGLGGGPIRLSGSFGVAPGIMFQANQVWHSVEDGFHKSGDVTSDFVKNDMNFIATFGPDINTTSSILQVHFIASFGTKNVYSSSGTQAAYSGKNVFYGFRLGVMF